MQLHNVMSGKTDSLNSIFYNSVKQIDGAEQSTDRQREWRDAMLAYYVEVLFTRTAAVARHSQDW